MNVNYWHIFKTILIFVIKCLNWKNMTVGWKVTSSWNANSYFDKDIFTTILHQLFFLLKLYTHLGADETSSVIFASQLLKTSPSRWQEKKNCKQSVLHLVPFVPGPYCNNTFLMWLDIFLVEIINAFHVKKQTRWRHMFCSLIYAGIKNVEVLDHRQFCISISVNVKWGQSHWEDDSASGSYWYFYVYFVCVNAVTHTDL